MRRRWVLAVLAASLVLTVTAAATAGSAPVNQEAAWELFNKVMGGMKGKGANAWRVWAGTGTGALQFAFRAFGIPFVAYLTYAAFSAWFQAWRASLTSGGAFPTTMTPGDSRVYAPSHPWSNTFWSQTSGNHTFTVWASSSSYWCSSTRQIKVESVGLCNGIEVARSSPVWPWGGSCVWDWAPVVAAVSACYNTWRTHVNCGGSVPDRWTGTKVYPGTGVEVPSTLQQAATQTPSELEANMPDLWLKGEELIKQQAGNPPQSRAAYVTAGITMDPDPDPYLTGSSPQPTPGASPTPGTAPTPGPTPTATPAPESEEITPGFLTSLVAWAVETVRSMVTWAVAQLQQALAWVVGEIRGLFLWVVETIVQQVGWLGGEIQAVRAELLKALGSVKEAIEALPEQITSGIQAAVQNAAEAAFKPQQSSITQFQQLGTKLQTKPPLSFLPPASLFPDPGGSACVLPSIPAWTLHSGAGHAHTITWEWPSFVCTFAAWLRAFFLVAFYASMGWWMVTRLFPQVTLG